MTTVLSVVSITHPTLSTTPPPVVIEHTDVDTLLRTSYLLNVRVKVMVVLLLVSNLNRIDIVVVVTLPVN